jgi:hypothetical protein
MLPLNSHCRITAPGRISLSMACTVKDWIGLMSRHASARSACRARPHGQFSPQQPHRVPVGKCLASSSAAVCRIRLNSASAETAMLQRAEVTIGAERSGVVMPTMMRVP